MSKPQRKKQNQVKLARLGIVAQLYKRGNSFRQIQAEVKKRLGLPTYGLTSVHRDVHSLLDEWRESRIGDMDAALQLELERIDDTVRELWSQWEKSKKVGLGNPAYISEIRQQLAERRKLLGLYAPEKKDISGSLSFADYLIESGLIDDAEEQKKQ